MQSPIPKIPYKVKLLIDIIAKHYLSAEEAEVLSKILWQHAYYKKALSPVEKMMTDLEGKFLMTKQQKAWTLDDHLDFTNLTE